jgi:7,8-dihydropterin-6-yl-methyl-4-(beta-D-ribofuranosyl)aminobenzene 5'-phosphate synthase
MSSDGADETLSISVVYNNKTANDDLLPAWGFACVIDGLEKRVLFDTGGDGEILLANMTKMGISPESIDILILSHHHWDHVGGLEEFIAVNSDIDVYLLSMFPDTIKAIAGSGNARVHEADTSFEIIERLHTTGMMGTNVREQSVVLETARGLVLITGCAHPGIADIVDRMEADFDQSILLALGGFHLIDQSKSQVAAIINRIDQANVKYVAACHCTGDEATKSFAERFEDRFIEIGVGKAIKVGEL